MAAWLPVVSDLFVDVRPATVSWLCAVHASLHVGWQLPYHALLFAIDPAITELQLHASSATTEVLLPLFCPSVHL